MKIINLFGAPGAGKSTTAAMLFAKMKLAGYKVELVTEYAKELTYTESFQVLGDQINVFATQHHRIHRLIGRVDYIVTDAPILNSLIYGDESSRHFRELVFEKHSEYQNINVYINRVKEYAKYGRTQTEEESDALGLRIRQMLSEYNQKYLTFDGGADAADNILNSLQA